VTGDQGQPEECAQIVSFFDPECHIVNICRGAEVALVEPDGAVLQGIRGIAGASAYIESGMAVGADRIIMQPGAEFELHTHPGAHILYVLAAHGFIHINGIDYAMAKGDTVYVPAAYPHGVKTDPAVRDPLELLAFGVPHMPLSSRHRMSLVDGPDDARGEDEWEMGGDAMSLAAARRGAPRTE
jgi:quercetin dioxygenase-like cupin family protein